MDKKTPNDNIFGPFARTTLGVVKTGMYTIIDGPITLGENVYIGNYVHIRPNAKIGDRTEIRDYCFIAQDTEIGHDTIIWQFSDICAGMKVGNNCFIGINCMTLNDDEIAYPKTHRGWVKEPPIIEDYVRIGGGVVLLPGVTIAHHCKIGAGSVVTKSTESNSLYVGNPAKKLGIINEYNHD